MSALLDLDLASLGNRLAINEQVEAIEKGKQEALFRGRRNRNQDRVLGNIGSLTSNCFLLCLDHQLSLPFDHFS